MTQKTFVKFAVLVSMLCGAVDATASEDRINLWPLFYSDPPDSMGCFPLFYKDRGEFMSLPVCWGYESREGRYVESHFLPFYAHKAYDRFLSMRATFPYGIAFSTTARRRRDCRI